MPIPLPTVTRNYTGKMSEKEPLSIATRGANVRHKNKKKVPVWMSQEARHLSKLASALFLASLAKQRSGGIDQ
jgi:hypothetical protein